MTAGTPLESLIARWETLIRRPLHHFASEASEIHAAILTALKASREKDAAIAYLRAERDELRSKVAQLTAALGHSEQERLVARQREAGL